MPEIGAGTGRYSIALAKEGPDVTAVEPAECNLSVLRENSRGIRNIRSFQGDAADLSRLPDNTFDETLVFGPIYRLYEPADVNKAIDEAIEKRPDFNIPDADFDRFCNWYLTFAEKRELLGSTNHLLYVCRKRGRPSS